MRIITDIETLRECFTVTFLDYNSDNYWQFEISEYKNEFEEAKLFYEKIKYNITFNGNWFDNIVTNWLFSHNLDNNIPGKELAEEIYKVAQIVINKDNDYQSYDKYKKFQKSKFKSIDLFLYWSKMLRLSKKLSLKAFAASMGMSIEEMPIHHSATNLTQKDIQLIKEYNHNDCIVTKELAKKLKEQINLRIDIQKKYGLDCLSWDAPKIASELLLKSYCEKTYDSNVFSTLEDYIKYVRSRRYTKKDFIIGDYLPKFEFKNQQLKKLYSRILTSKNVFKEDVIWKNPDGSFIKISVSSGGIHTENNIEKYFGLVTCDIESMYPTNILNYKFISPELGDEMLEIYKDIKTRRVEAKKRGDDVENTVLKLILNSTSGLLDNEYSWLYSPEQATALRLTGQLQLLKLLEMLYENNISIKVMNTDGLELVCDDKNLLDNILKEHSKFFNVNWEVDKYKSMYLRSVNDYIAVTEKGKVKTKGELIYDHILDGSNEFTIIPLAIKEYLVNNIPVEKTIKECKELWRFTTSKKVDKKYDIYYNGQKQLNHLNRYFVSTKGAYLYKSKDGIKMEALLKDLPIYICNEDIRNVNIEDYPIDYNWYINKTNQKIEEWFPKQLTLF